MTRQQARSLARLVADDRLRDALGDAYEVIDQITHKWTNSGLDGRCASCGLGSDDVWHTRVFDMVNPAPQEHQEALL